MTNVEVDLSTVKLRDVGGVELRKAETVTVHIPMPSIGRTNQHIDICWDYIDASWAAERLAAACGSAKLTEEYIAEEHLTRFTLTLGAPDQDFRSKLEDVVRVFQAQQDEESGEGDRYQALRDEISDYQDTLGGLDPSFPGLVDSYFANLISGAYHQIRADAPDYYDDLVKKNPEHELGFHRSAYSNRIGGNCFASTDSWLIPNSVELDRFFVATEQNYRLSDFVEGEVLTIAGKSFVLSDGMASYFPMNQYFKSRACASFVQRHDEDIWPDDMFAWLDATFTHSPFGEHIQSHVPESLRGAGPRRESCLVHTTGTLIVINDGTHCHILYDTKPLEVWATKRLYEKICDASQQVAAAIGLSDSLALDWKTLSDEQFEQLCYDILYAHARFDPSTIRKLGSSRSRDGGRDIEIWEAAKSPGGTRRKWVFQCKLTQSNSLGATKVQDIGDMLDQYEAKGFGVMTSALIDATLYDKIDGVCGRRSIESLNFSVLELNRTLIRNATIRRRYFPNS